MVCTAGHVDHGKTSLVKWLTGCETDVLKEEKERGMTIEPGFAPCSTVAGVSVGITDVPGHEKFVHHMVAGVSGVGMCILVIAADDGIMPQTVEHFQIMELLGVERGVVALTKMDLVDAATRERRIGEIRAWLANGFLKDAPSCPVSSETGDGCFRWRGMERCCRGCRYRAGSRKGIGWNWCRGGRRGACGGCSVSVARRNRGARGCAWR